MRPRPGRTEPSSPRRPTSTRRWTPSCPISSRWPTQPIPVGIYNNPIRVGTDLTAEAVIRLAEHPNIVIDKEAMARPGQIAQILAAGKDMALMCCDSPHLGLVPAVMALGGQGTANMTGNIAPREMAIISTPWESHADALAFRETYLRLLPLIQFTYSKVNPVPVKSLAKVLGLPAGELRKPYRGLSGRALRDGVEIVRRLGWWRQYGYTIREDLIPDDDRPQSMPDPPRRAPGVALSADRRNLAVRGQDEKESSHVP